MWFVGFRVDMKRFSRLEIRSAHVCFKAPHWDVCMYFEVCITADWCCVVFVDTQQGRCTIAAKRCQARRETHERLRSILSLPASSGRHVASSKPSFRENINVSNPVAVITTKIYVSRFPLCIMHARAAETKRAANTNSRNWPSLQILLQTPTETINKLFIPLNPT